MSGASLWVLTTVDNWILLLDAGGRQAASKGSSIYHTARIKRMTKTIVRVRGGETTKPVLLDRVGVPRRKRRKPGELGPGGVPVATASDGEPGVKEHDMRLHAQ